MTDRTTLNPRPLHPHRHARAKASKAKKTKAKPRKKTKAKRKPAKRKAAKSKPVKRKATKPKPVKRKATKPVKRKAPAPSPVRSQAAKKGAETRRKKAEAEKAKRSAAAKKGLETKRRKAEAARAAFEARSQAAKKGAETKKARALSSEVIDLRARADESKKEEERAALEAEAARKSALIQEAADRHAKEEARLAKERHEEYKKRVRNARKRWRIEKAKKEESPPDAEELAQIRTAMTDLAFRFVSPIEVTHSLFQYSDNTIDARMRFSGFGEDWYDFLTQLSSTFIQDILPNYPLLKKEWWVRIRIETEELETKFREVTAVGSDPKKQWGKQTTRINVIRKLERSAISFEMAKMISQDLIDEGKIIVAYHLWFYRSKTRPVD